MSPEQVRGVAVDARSDIFSFGAILYEILSGKRAFHGDTSADTMSAILKDDPPDLTETNRNISPALDRIVQHCLEKNPESRFHSASDIAFDLEHLSGLSGSASKMQPLSASASKSKAWLTSAIVGVSALATLAIGWWLGGVNARAPIAEYKQVTFRTGSMGNARFTPDGSIVYSANWDGEEKQLYTARRDDPGARELGIKHSELLGISKNGELAIRLRSVPLGGYASVGTLARVPLSGGTPREVLDNVQDADWAADGESMAVVRYSPENSHWRLEYPVGNVLVNGINWISQPKISPDGKWVAFSDHENTAGDDQGTIAVIATGGGGKQKNLSSGWSSIEGILWSPSGNEVWFTAAGTGGANNPRAVTLSGKVRTITNVPGGIWFQDIQNGAALAIAQRTRLGIRGVAPGSKEEKELGWFGWSELRDMSRDGKKILFEEESDGGGPNYTVFLRDTDGSPPSRIGEGVAMGLSPDGKWAISKPAKGEALTLIPTGAGQSRQLTHDKITYNVLRWFPDNKRVLASGIEPGHGPRNYIIDIASGESKPVTPEGVAGARLSPDGTVAPVLGADGKWSIWPVAGGESRPIPGLDSSYLVIGWAPDGKTLLGDQTQDRGNARKIFRVDPVTGRVELWKTFGEQLAANGALIVPPRFSNDGSAYAYMYVQSLSQGYVVTGLK
jgi:Tol biopolymer transport system component